MLKGTKRSLVMVRGGRGSEFEVAYFLLRQEKVGEAPEPGDMVAQAERMIRECAPPRHRRKKRAGRLMLFLCGLAAGGAIGALVAWIVQIY